MTPTTRGSTSRPFSSWSPRRLAASSQSNEPGAPFAITGSYFDAEERIFESKRDGICIHFRDRSLPFERLFCAHEGAGLLVEAVREPRPSEEFIEVHPIAARRL